MTSNEKAELMKSTIEHLYSKEGRSKSYISRLLNINRKTISDKIQEWRLPEAPPMHYLTPSNRKFLNKHRDLIKSRLDHDVPMTKIAEELRITRHTLYRTFIMNDDVLRQCHSEYINRMRTNAESKRQDMMDASSRKYNVTDLEGEVWRSILGYENYFVSNMGRIKKYIKSYDTYMLIQSFPNKNNGRLYVSLSNGDQTKNLSVARLVAYAFIDGHSDTNNTVNHDDGNITNNRADNLSWSSQSENNKHAYDKLHRSKVKSKRYKFDKIIYKGKYEFKTVAAFARFIGKSETQVRRYLDEPKKHDIQIVKNCND